MKILISAGPTREKIDPVRFLSNRSSGKMGYALAQAAADAGHDVTLVSGPVTLPVPSSIETIYVESALEMFTEIKTVADTMDIIIMAAAVADYRPAITHDHKLKKSSGNLVLELERTDDILAYLGNNKLNTQCLVGFAAETKNLTGYAKEKLRKKNLDWIIANDVSQQDRGFNADSNAVTMLSRSGKRIDLALSSKLDIARDIIRVIISEIK